MSSDVALSSGSVHQLNELVERNGVASLNEKAGKPGRAAEAEGLAVEEQNADIKSENLPISSQSVSLIIIKLKNKTLIERLKL